jgi:hypothetical protein
MFRGAVVVVIAARVVIVRMGEAMGQIETYGFASVVMVMRQCREHYGRRTDDEDHTQNQLIGIATHNHAQRYDFFSDISLYFFVFCGL